MELEELTPDEDVALLALMREIIQADGDYSIEEQVLVAELRDEMGADRFDRAVAGATQRLATRRQLAAFVPTITRPGARKLIMRRLVMMSAADRVIGPEAQALRWLAEKWPGSF
ncbi:MAG: hypothetical protein H6719_17340 [Sandaracinaceae bacterium]|nr:hypothetical protein [Sandaracinaceae bacterium]